MDIILRTVASFFILFLLTRVLGKKQISQLTFFNYVAGITIGSTAAEIIVAENITVLEGAYSLATWTALTILFGIVGLKSPKARVALDDQPSIVIKKGKILENTMSSLRMNMDDLSMLLRNQNVFSVSEVDYAILEPNGQLSVLKKKESQNVTNKDMGLPTTPPLYMPTELIVDGKLVSKNMKELNLSMDWLAHELVELGVNDAEEVFYAELQSDGTLHIDLKEDLIY